MRLLRLSLGEVQVTFSAELRAPRSIAKAEKLDRGLASSRNGENSLVDLQHCLRSSCGTADGLANAHEQFVPPIYATSAVIQGMPGNLVPSEVERFSQSELRAYMNYVGQVCEKTVIDPIGLGNVY